MPEASPARLYWDPLWLARLSHDLRNELVPLRTATDLLRCGRLDADSEREMIGMIDRQTRRLVRMLDDLAEYGRALSAPTPVASGTVDLAVLVEDALTRVDEGLRAAGHTMQLELPPEAIEVRGDATRLTQLLTRLLDNAVRFTPPAGDIAVRVSCQASAIMIEVADSGRGIAPELRESVFRPPLERGEADGLGLSLALARRCAQDCGGELEAGQDPRLGGALFRLTLRRA